VEGLMKNAVLVVEDDEINLNFLVAALNRNG
jgi:CheY-like chemotaxis protein